MAEVKYIAFRLGEQKYAMKLTRINGLEDLYEVVPIPVGAENIKGIIHLRGMIVPIYNLKRHFNMPEEGKKSTSQLLITEIKDMKLGFEVDEVLGIVAVSEEDINDVPTVVQNDETGYLENIVRLTLPEQTKPEIVISINIDKLMTEAEVEGVKEALLDKDEDEKAE